jgi:hypothetical protein
VLAFQRAYALAFRELDPTGQVLAPARPLPRSETPDLQAGDRLLVFLRLDRCPDCAATLAAAQKAALKTGAQLDLYVVGADSDEALRRWADRQRLDRRALKTGRLTLNHEWGELTTVAGLVLASTARLPPRRITPGPPCVAPPTTSIRMPCASPLPNASPSPTRWVAGLAERWPAGPPWTTGPHWPAAPSKTPRS